MFHYLLPFFRQLHNSFQNILSFWAKNYSRCLLQSSREWKFFPLREFYKDQNKRKSEGAMSGEYGGWIRTSQPSSNSFCLSSKKHVVLRYPNGRLYLFCWLILDAFHQSSATFNWSKWEQYLLELITCFPEGAHNRGFPSNPTVYTTSPSLDESWPLVWLVAVCFTCPTDSSVPHYCTVSTFHCLSQFVFKIEHFYFVSVENHIQKYGQGGFFFFHLTYVKPKHQAINISKQVQMIFNACFGYIGYVGYLPCGIMLFVLS